MLQIIKSLIITLEKAEVRGKDNLDMLLGCIQTLEKLLETIKDAQEREVAGNDTENKQEENV
jgi:hypothetical protein